MLERDTASTVCFSSGSTLRGALWMLFSSSVPCMGWWEVVVAVPACMHVCVM